MGIDKASEGSSERWFGGQQIAGRLVLAFQFCSSFPLFSV